MASATLVANGADQVSGDDKFPWLALAPFALIPFVGGTADGLDRLLIAIEGLFLVLATRRPIWALAALLLSELTITNYMLDFGGTLISTRLVIAMVSFIVVAPRLIPRFDLGPRTRPMLPVAFVFVLFATGVNLAQSDTAYALQFLRFLLTGLVAMMVAAVAINDRKDLTHVGVILLTIATASGIVAIMQHFSGSGAPLYQVVPNATVPSSFESWGNRAIGLTENPIYLANNLVLVLLPLIGVLLSTEPSSRNWKVLALLALTLTVALYFTYTRSWIFSTGLGMVSVAVLYRGPMRRELWLALLVAAAAFWYTTDTTANRYILGLGSDDADAGSIRPALFSAGFSIALENPYVGVGHDRFIELAPRYNSDIPRLSADDPATADVIGNFAPHNDFLNVWLSFGFFALLVYSFFLLLIAQNFFEVFTQARDPALIGLGLGLFAAVLTYAVNSSFHNILDTSLSIWLLAGFSLALTKLLANETHTLTDGTPVEKGVT